MMPSIEAGLSSSSSSSAQAGAGGINVRGGGGSFYGNGNQFPWGNVFGQSSASPATWLLVGLAAVAVGFGLWFLVKKLR